MPKKHKDLEIVYAGKKYSLTKDNRIGNGGIGDVYLLPEAKTKYGEDVVVKVFRFCGRWSKQSYQRFKDEFDCICRLCSKCLEEGTTEIPLIVPEVECSLPDYEDLTSKKIAWFAMPFSNAYKFERSKSASEITGILLQVLSSLEFLHRHGISHRDIKASNILQKSDGNWVLSDYGMIFFERNGGFVTGGKQSMRIHGGPPELQTMEQFENFSPDEKLKVMKKSDIYLFGKLCWQLFVANPFYFEGPFFLKGRAMMDFYNATIRMSCVPFTPIVRLLRNAIKDDYSKRCDLDSLEFELKKQMELFVLYEQKETDNPIYQKEQNEYEDIVNRLDISSDGDAYFGKNAETILRSYSNALNMEIVRDGELIVSFRGTISYSIQNACFCCNAGIDSYFFRCIALFYRNDDVARFEIELASPSTIAATEMQRPIILDSGFKIRVL